jgi:hypothetical protein
VIKWIMRFALAIGLVLLLTSIVLFARGFWAADTFIISRWIVKAEVADRHSLHISTDARILSLIWHTESIDPNASHVRREFLHSNLTFVHGVYPTRGYLIIDARPSFWQRLGFTARIIEQRGGALTLGERRRVLFLPSWFVVLMLLLFMSGPALYLRRLRRRESRRVAGLCVDCGYDLRSSEGRCPECGREFTTESRRHGDEIGTTDGRR